MFQILEEINTRPKPFGEYSASDLWTDDHTSKQMLAFHLNGGIDVSSRTSAFIEESVDWISSHFGVGAGFRIADFGCGPGLYSGKLSERKAAVVGIDFSTRSILHAQAVAAREGLSVRYVNQDYLEFDTDERFDLVMMIMCDYCALSPSQRRIMLRKFHSFLSPGGAVLLDVYSLIGFNEREDKTVYMKNLLDGFWSPRDYYGFLNTFKYEAEKTVLDKYTIVESDRIRTVYNWLQYFSPEDLEAEFADVGFKVDGLFSNVAGGPYDPQSDEFAVVAIRA